MGIHQVEAALLRDFVGAWREGGELGNLLLMILGGMIMEALESFIRRDMRWLGNCRSRQVLRPSPA